MASYKNINAERNEKLTLDLSVNVLSASSWPTYATVPVILPPQIKFAIDKFETHYKAKHTGRKLEFKHSLAHCQLKAKFPKGNKELVVSSFQAIVLLLFNGLGPDEHIDYNYLKEATGLRKAPSTSTSLILLTCHLSATRTQPYPPIPCLCQTTPTHQAPQGPRHQPHRHLHPKQPLHRPQVPNQDQHRAAQRNASRKQGNPRTCRC